MFYMNAFQVRILISVFVRCHWHWCPLVTTGTPGPTLDPDGTGVHGPAAVSTSVLRHGTLINLIFIWGRPQWPMGVLVLSWVSLGRDTLYTRLHDYSGVWWVHRQHCCRSACQTPGDLFNPKLHNHELREFAGGRLSGIGAVPRL